MTTMKHTLCAVATGLLLSLSGPAWGQEAMSPNELDKDLARWVGRSVTVEGKYREKWGGNWLKLMGSDTKYYARPKSALAKNLINSMDEAGQKLVKERSNVRVVGTVYRKRGQPASIYIYLDKLVKLKNDIERFEDKVKASLASQPPKALHAIALEAQAWAKQYNTAELVEWSVECHKRAFRLRTEKRKPGDVKVAESIAADYLTHLDDDEAAIELLSQCLKEVKADNDKDALIKALKTYGAVQYRGKWRSKSQFMLVQGFVKRAVKGKGTWILKQRAELLDHVEADLKRKDSFYVNIAGAFQRAADDGKVKLGMKYEHIVALKINGGRKGFSSYVDRESTDKTPDKKERQYVQWVYKDGSRFYFVNGRLFAFHTREEALPNK